jgi:hypothetical protein
MEEDRSYLLVGIGVISGLIQNRIQGLLNFMYNSDMDIGATRCGEDRKCPRPPHQHL